MKKIINVSRHQVLDTLKCGKPVYALNTCTEMLINSRHIIVKELFALIEMPDVIFFIVAESEGRYERDH